MNTSFRIGWLDRSGPTDIVGFCGIYQVARVYKDSWTGLWVWSVAWLAGIRADGAADDKVEAIRAAEAAVAGFVHMSGLAVKPAHETVIS